MDSIKISKKISRLTDGEADVPDCSQIPKPDRYVSFAGIESDRNSKELIAMLLRHLEAPEHCNPFWGQFKEKLAKVGKPGDDGKRCLDELFLIHSYINNIRELLEQCSDDRALELLEQVELESC